MEDEPGSKGASHVTFARVLPGIAATEFETGDALPAPAAWMAGAVKLYAFRLSPRPIADVEFTPEVVAVAPSGCAVTIYPVPGEAPVSSGASQVTSAEPVCATA